MDKFLKNMKIRIIVSGVCLAMFVVLGALYAGKWIPSMGSIPVIASLLAGYFLLPRQTLPKGFVAQPDSQSDADFASRMKELQKRLVYARGVYFLIGVVVLVGFPSVF